MSRCNECGSRVHPHQLTCGSCGASLREDRPPGAEDDTLEKPDETEGFVLSDPLDLRDGDRVAAPPPTAEKPEPAPRRRRRRVRARTRGPVSSPAFVSRAWALVVDAMILTLASATLPTIAWIGIRAAEAVSGTTELYDDVITEQLTAIGRIALVASYFVFLTASTGQTVGKGLMDLHVVRADGQPPDPLQSLMRFVGYLFSALPLGFGFILAAFTPRRALHDYLAGTVVARPRDMPNPESGDTPT